MRFRSRTTSTRDTGRLIMVTLIGLICGLNLPHFAVLAALFAFILIYLFDAHPTCRLVVDGLPSKRTVESADVYRAVLAGLAAVPVIDVTLPGCRLLRGGRLRLPVKQLRA